MWIIANKRNMPEKTVYMHIGLHKTGTSSIQMAIWQNREILNEAGIFMPESGTVGPVRIHYNIAWFLTKDPRYLKHRGTHLDLVKEIDKSSNKKFLISSEDLCLLKDESIGELRESFGDNLVVKIIIYLRDPERWIISRWIQLVSSGYETKNLSEYVSAFCTRPQLYIDLVNRWGRFFGRENLIIRSYNDVIHSKGLLDDFWWILNIPNKHKKHLTVPENQNVSISYRLVELIRKISIRIDSDLRHLKYASSVDAFYKLLRQFESSLRTKYEKTTPKMSAEDRELVDKVYGPGNKLIAREFFGREELFPRQNYQELSSLPGETTITEGDLLDLLAFIGEKIIEQAIANKSEC